MFRLNPVMRGGICESAIILSFPLLAEDVEVEEAKQREPHMVVTASATEVNLKDAPASISVLTAEDIPRRPVQTLPDVLRDVPAVHLTTEREHRTGARLRGLPPPCAPPPFRLSPPLPSLFSDRNQRSVGVLAPLPGRLVGVGWIGVSFFFWGNFTCLRLFAPFLGVVAMFVFSTRSWFWCLWVFPVLSALC